MSDDGDDEGGALPRWQTAIRDLVGDLGGFRTRRRGASLIPYESLDSMALQRMPEFRALVEQRLGDGYRLGDFSIPSLVGPIDWHAHNRSFAYHLNAWGPINEVLMAHSIFGDDRYFEIACVFAREWLEDFQLRAFAIGPDPIALHTAFGPTPWYDMAVGQRAYRLAYIADIVAREPRYDEQDVALLLRSLIFHLHLLSRDDLFRAHNNHGFYQALGELAACRRFRAEPFFTERFEAATQRVCVAIDRQFLPSGIHREHSPGYHLMILSSLIESRESGLITSSNAHERIAAAEEMLTWLVQPDGALLTFGDTDPRRVQHERFAVDVFANPQLRYQLSGGAIGERPNRGLFALVDEGYVFARSVYAANAGDPWWYLAQIAAFHSRTHKHADDLSFVWSDRGAEILIDPGRYAYAGRTEPTSELAKQGFWYSDPKRIYVESTRAHNTVEIDGRAYDRTRKPYGSGLLGAGQDNGLIVTECDVHHSETVRHRRMLVMAPGGFLLVVDWLLDGAGQAHDFRQHFHFHPEWTVAPDQSGADHFRLIATRGASGQKLAILPLVPEQGAIRTVRGREEPELLGWYSDKGYSLIPCTTLVSERLGTDRAIFATLFTFATDAKPVPDRMLVSCTRGPATFAWEEGDEMVQIDISGNDAGQPILTIQDRNSTESDFSRENEPLFTFSNTKNETAKSCFSSDESEGSEPSAPLRSFRHSAITIPTSGTTVERMQSVRYDLSLFERLNEEYRTKPIVIAEKVETRRRTLSPTDEERAGQSREARVQAAARGQLAPVLRDVDIKGKVVLEVGCGHGYLTAAMAEVGQAARVIGVDVERSASWDEHAESPVVLVETDFSVVPIVDPVTVDVVVSHVVLEHVSRPIQMLSAIYDALTIDGTAWLKMNLYRSRNASHRYREVFFPWPQLLFDDEVCAEYYRKWHGKPNHFAWVNKMTVAEYLLAAHEIGFTIRRVERRVAPIDVPFYLRFQNRLGRYPALDLETEFMTLVLDKRARAPQTFDLGALGISYVERQNALEEAIVRYVIEQETAEDGTAVGDVATVSA